MIRGHATVANQLTVQLAEHVPVSSSSASLTHIRAGFPVDLIDQQAHTPCDRTITHYHNNGLRNYPKPATFRQQLRISLERVCHRQLFAASYKNAHHPLLFSSAQSSPLCSDIATNRETLYPFARLPCWVNPCSC
ncbi:hypothetical protein AWENTII_011120 [Aspergillus wentii]